MAFYDAAANRQADTRSRKLLIGMEAFKNLKHLVMVPRVDTNAIVRHGEHPLVVLLPGRQANHWRLAAAVFEAIAQHDRSWNTTSR